MKLLSVLVLTLVTSLASAQRADVLYSDGNVRLKGYLAKPDKIKAKVPGVVILHAWMGLTDHEKESADKLAESGYIALAADVYGEGVKVKSAEEAGKLSGMFKSDRKLYRARIQAAINEIIKAGADPGKIAVIGYCFGGTGALEAARANLPVKGVVSFHGGLDKGNEATQVIKPKVLVLHGADDPYAPEQQVEAFQDEMRAAKADWQFIAYSDAVHAFTDPAAGSDKSKGVAYNEAAAKRSWSHMKLFLNEIFGSSSGK